MTSMGFPHMSYQADAPAPTVPYEEKSTPGLQALPEHQEAFPVESAVKLDALPSICSQRWIPIRMKRRMLCAPSRHLIVGPDNESLGVQQRLGGIRRKQLCR